MAKDRATQAHLAVLTAELLVASKCLGSFWGPILMRGWRVWPRLGAVRCRSCGRAWSSPHGLDMEGDPRCCGELVWDRVRKTNSSWSGAANDELRCR